jgi:hypothetical protein
LAKDKTSWFPFSYEKGNRKAVGELKRLDFFEMAALDAAVGGAQATLPEKKVLQAMSSAEIVAVFARYHRALPKDEVMTAFRDYVRNVTVTEGGEPVTLDGGPVTTGEQMLLVAPQFVMQVLDDLRTHGALSEALGKASSSPSTSTQERGMPDGPSDAKDTAPADGTAISTAPETPPAETPSSSPA